MKKIPKIVLLLLIAVIGVMIVASVVEKTEGHEYVVSKLYCSEWAIGLWAVLSVVSLVLIVTRRIWKRPVVLLLHVALMVILGGALTTHLLGVNGVLHLRQGESSNMFVLPDNHTSMLDFNVKLDSFQIHYYAGTDTPSDYSSILSIHPYKGEVERGNVSMNHVLDYDGYRFYQSAYDDDGKGTVLAVSYDPYGIAITYVGYGLLLLAVLMFFFDKKSQWRNAVRRIGQIGLLLLLALMPTESRGASLKSAPADVAHEMGNVLVLYNGRVCPLNTLSRDFTQKIYKSHMHEGFDADEVMCGWLFYPGMWRDDLQLDMSNPKDQQKKALLESLFSGGLIKVFPVEHEGKLEWMSRSDDLPSDLPADEWKFIRKLHSYLQEMIMTSQYDDALVSIEKLQKYQRKKAPELLPNVEMIKVEKVYNSLSHTRMIAILSLIIGLASFAMSLIFIMRQRKSPKWFGVAIMCASVILLLYLSVLIGLRWVVMGSVPLTNGYEAMEFMTWAILVLAMVFGRRFVLIQPIGLLLSGFALLVALMGESDPPIASVMPVLSSPLLCVHVMIVMLAYALLAIVCLLSVSALIISRLSKSSEMVERLGIINQLLLTPAVFLLAIGIFIGAVWANVSWGSYWQWDPKETWALITMLVYAIPLHRDFMSPKKVVTMHTYLVLAFFSVLVTYFGVNYILGGMHSYA